MLKRAVLSRISGLFLCVDMPNNVVWKTDNLVLGALSHLGETFRLGLVFKCVAGEVDS